MAYNSCNDAGIIRALGSVLRRNPVQQQAALIQGNTVTVQSIAKAEQRPRAPADMTRRGINRPGLQLATLLLAALAAGQLAAADTADRLLQQLKPYADAGVSYDSNFFRVASLPEVDALYDGQDTPSDTIYTARFGVDGEFDVSRQNFLVIADIFRNWNEDFSEQSFTGGNAELLWNWRIGERWDGELGYGFDRDLQDYANQTVRTATPGVFVAKGRDIRSRQSVKGRADYAVTPDWSVYVRGKITDVSFRVKDQLDLERTVVGTGFNYLTEVGNRFGFDTEFVSGDFEQAVQPDFDEFNFGPTANWEVSGKTRLRGKVAYTSRDFDDPQQEDFDGITWRATLVRNPGEESFTEFALYREISTLNDDISNYAVIDGVRIDPVWKVSGKTLARFTASYEIRDFKGVGNLNSPVLFGDNREDKVANVGAAIEWEATRFITVSAGYTFEDRQSNRVIEEYDFHLLELQFRGGF